MSFHGIEALRSRSRSCHYRCRDTCFPLRIQEWQSKFKAFFAGIYDAQVLEKFRRRGIGTAPVRAALVDPRERLGYGAAVLAATGAGFGVYARLGLREVCKLSFWKYGKMRQQQQLEKVLRKAIRDFWNAAPPRVLQACRIPPCNSPETFREAAGYSP
jgi:GNAT superfamily N-acetyltransferase